MLPFPEQSRQTSSESEAEPRDGSKRSEKSVLSRQASKKEIVVEAGSAVSAAAARASVNGRPPGLVTTQGAVRNAIGAKPALRQALTVKLETLACMPNQRAVLPPPVAPFAADHPSVGGKKKIANARKLLRLTDPNSKLIFLGGHPYFQDTSTYLQERLAPQMVRRSQEREFHDEVAPPVIEQGDEPATNTDYLFLTGPDSHTRLEVLYDGRPIASLGDCSVFGQEAIFGVSKSFLFSVRVAVGSVNSLWVIPRAVLQSLMLKEAFKKDAIILKDRAERQTVALLHSWYIGPSSHIRLRLFQNADHAFKAALMRSMALQITPAGATIRTEKDDDDTCFCIFRGEAQVLVNGGFLTKLSHDDGTSGWAAWFGLLECLGVCKTSPVRVNAVADSIIWKLKPDDLVSLRKMFPTECRMFDKVAVEHLKLLAPAAPTIGQVSLFSRSGAAFVRSLMDLQQQRICGSGQVLIEEFDESRECFYLARGNAEVRKRDSSSAKRASMLKKKATSDHVITFRDNVTLGESAKLILYGNWIANCAQGDLFGELTALGCHSERSASVLTTSMCDLRVFPGEDIVDLLKRWPQEATVFAALFAQHDYPDVQEALQKPIHSCELFSDASYEFLNELAFVTTTQVFFNEDLVFDQGVRMEKLYTLLAGAVSVVVDDRRLTELDAPAIFGDFAVVQDGGETGTAALASWFAARSVGCSVFAWTDIPTVRNILKDRYPDERALLRKLGEERDEEVKELLLRSEAVGLGLGIAGDAAAPPDSDPIDEVAEQVQELVNGSDFMKECDIRFATFLVHNMKKEVYLSGQVIIRENDDGDYAVIVKSGECHVDLEGTRVGEVKAGAIIGEVAALGIDTRRTATVTASTLVTGYVLTHHVITAAFEYFPGEHERIMKIVQIRKDVNKALTGEKIETQTALPTKMGLFGGLQKQRRPSIVQKADHSHRHPSPLPADPSQRRPSKNMLLKGGVLPKARAESPCPMRKTSRPGSGRQPGLKQPSAAAHAKVNIIAPVLVAVTAVRVGSKKVKMKTDQSDSLSSLESLAEQKPHAEFGAPSRGSDGGSDDEKGAASLTASSRHLSLGANPWQSDVGQPPTLIHHPSLPASAMRRPADASSEQSDSPTKTKKFAKLDLIPDIRPLTQQSPEPDGPWSLLRSDADSDGSPSNPFDLILGLADDDIDGEDLIRDRPLTSSEQWAQNRKRMMVVAPKVRIQRLAKADQMMPIIPRDQGYTVPSTPLGGSGTAAIYPWAPASKFVCDQRGAGGTGSGRTGSAGAAPWRRRLQKAVGIYGAPVWSDSHS